MSIQSRERVLRALSHEEPDRVPLFAPNVMNTRTPYDEQVQQFLDTFAFDRFAQPGRLVDHPSDRREVTSDIYVDGYGCQYEYRGVGLPYCVHSPLANAHTIADVEAFDWPDPELPGQIADDTLERVQAACAQGRHAITVGLAPIFHQYHYLRGFEQWMLDVKLNPGVHEAIASRVSHIHGTLLTRLLEQVGAFVDIVTGGDDFGWSVAPYMSPQDFRRLVKPHYRKLIGCIKRRYPHIKFYLHSHGQILDLVPDLVECGVDILNPILPLDHMDPTVLKSRFGNLLCFHGGIDVEHILPFGTVREVRDHVRKVIDVLAPGGGYWFKAQVISPVIPPENVIAAYEAALEYGRYQRSA
jgi:uroporphyrinogen decarboxylase